VVANQSDQPSTSVASCKHRINNNNYYSTINIYYTKFRKSGLCRYVYVPHVRTPVAERFKWFNCLRLIIYLISHHVFTIHVFWTVLPVVKYGRTVELTTQYSLFTIQCFCRSSSECSNVLYPPDTNTLFHFSLSSITL